jgi:acylphosphatase
MTMKQAIEYNPAGFVKNLPNDVVNFTAQGDAKRLSAGCVAIQEEPTRSSDIKGSTTEGTVDPALNAFTIYAWTSTSRNITDPYNLSSACQSTECSLRLDVKILWHAI